MNRRIAASIALLVSILAATLLLWNPTHGRVARQEQTIRRHNKHVVCQKRQPVFYVGIALNRPTPYNLHQFTQAARTKPTIIEFYQMLGQPLNIDAVSRIDATGALPLMVLDPRHASLAGIAARRYDRIIARYGSEIRATGCTMAISFAHEPNGNWYPWGWTHVAPATYIAAWRHVHDVVNATGAKVTWVWAVNRFGSGQTSSVARWWPGGQYVDWIGLDAYYRQPEQTFHDVFTLLHRAVRRLSADPILITETAIGPSRSRSRRIVDLFTAAMATHMLGLIWFDENAKQHWQINDDPAALAIFRSQIQRSTQLEGNLHD